MMRRPSPTRAGLSRTGLLLLLLIGATLVGLANIGVQRVTEVRRRIECSNNLRQIGIALIRYDTTNGGFPSDNNPLHPDQSFYQQLLDGFPPEDPVPGGIVQYPSAARYFVCPGRRKAADVLGACDYGYVESSGTTSLSLLDGRPGVIGKDVSNAASTPNTAILSHFWMSPADYGKAEPRWASRTGHSVPYSKAKRAYLDTDPAGVGSMGSPHPNGMPTVFADGHVGVLLDSYPQWQVMWDYSNTTVARQGVP